MCVVMVVTRMYFAAEKRQAGCWRRYWAGNIVTTHLQNAEPFTGYAELVDGEIASDLTNYLYTSEQTPSSVALGVLVSIKRGRS